MVCTARARSRLNEIDTKWSTKFGLRVLHNLICGLSIAAAVNTLKGRSNFQPDVYRYSNAVVYYLPIVPLTIIWNLANIVTLMRKQHPLHAVANAIVHFVLATAFAVLGSLATAYCVQGFNSPAVDLYGIRTGTGVHDLTAINGTIVTVSPQNIASCPAFPNCEMQEAWMMGIHRRALLALIGCILVDLAFILHVVFFIFGCRDAVFGTKGRFATSSIDEEISPVRETKRISKNERRMTLGGRVVSISDPTLVSAPWMTSQQHLLDDPKMTFALGNATRSSLSLAIFAPEPDIPLAPKRPCYRERYSHGKKQSDSSVSALPQAISSSSRPSQNSEISVSSDPNSQLIYSDRVKDRDSTASHLSALATRPAVSKFSRPRSVYYPSGYHEPNIFATSPDFRRSIYRRSSSFRSQARSNRFSSQSIETNTDGMISTPARKNRVSSSESQSSWSSLMPDPPLPDDPRFSFNTPPIESTVHLHHDNVLEARGPRSEIVVSSLSRPISAQTAATHRSTKFVPALANTRPPSRALSTCSQTTVSSLATTSLYQDDSVSVFSLAPFQPMPRASFGPEFTSAWTAMISGEAPPVPEIPPSLRSYSPSRLSTSTAHAESFRGNSCETEETAISPSSQSSVQHYRYSGDSSSRDSELGDGLL